MAIRHNAGGDELFQTTNVPAVNGPWTFSIWVNPTTWADGQFPAVQINIDAGSAYADYHFIGGNGGSPPLLMIDADGTTNNGSVLNTGQWYHVLGVRGAAANRTDLYLDGVLDAQVTNAVGAAANAEQHIGNDGAGGFLDGRMAAFKWWDVALSAAEREQERWQYVPVRLANLQGFYPLRDLNEIEDYSGNGDDFTAAGTPTTEDGPPIPWEMFPLGTPYLAAAVVGGRIMSSLVAHGGLAAEGGIAGIGGGLAG